MVNQTRKKNSAFVQKNMTTFGPPKKMKKMKVVVPEIMGYYL